MSRVILAMVWDGEKFTPKKPFDRIARERYASGAIVTLEEFEERNMTRHNGQFASLGELWRELPSSILSQSWAATPEHLRKFALIATGYHNAQIYTCGTRAEALRWAHNLRSMDEFSVVNVDGTIITVLTAKSQSLRAMKARDFYKSKHDVIEWVENLMTRTLESEAEKCEL